MPTALNYPLYQTIFDYIRRNQGVYKAHLAEHFEKSNLSWVDGQLATIEEHQLYLISEFENRLWAWTWEELIDMW